MSDRWRYADISNIVKRDGEYAVVFVAEHNKYYSGYIIHDSGWKNCVIGNILPSYFYDNELEALNNHRKQTN